MGLLSFIPKCFTIFDKGIESNIYIRTFNDRFTIGFIPYSINTILVGDFAILCYLLAHNIIFFVEILNQNCGAARSRTAVRSTKKTKCYNHAAVLSRNYPLPRQDRITHDPITALGTQSQIVSKESQLLQDVGLEIGLIRLARVKVNLSSHCVVV